jgi:hypothetical protein
MKIMAKQKNDKIQIVEDRRNMISYIIEAAVGLAIYTSLMQDLMTPKISKSQLGEIIEKLSKNNYLKNCVKRELKKLCK